VRWGSASRATYRPGLTDVVEKIAILKQVGSDEENKVAKDVLDAALWK
jgi:hypothetical protein